MEVKFYNCETEREDSLTIDNMDTNIVEGEGYEYEILHFDVHYRGENVNRLGEYVNTSKYGEKSVERTDNLLCIGSGGRLALMELIGLSREDYVPTHEIWDALDAWLSASAGE